MRLSILITIFMLLQNGCVSHLALNGSSKTVLRESGWNPYVKARLKKIIDEQRGQNLPVIFDFDNTIICRDIGEATFGVMVRDQIIKKSTIPNHVTPINTSLDLIEIYNTYLKATSHHVLDRAPYLNAYAWQIQIFAGLSPNQIIDATKLAYANGVAEHDRRTPMTTSITAVPGKAYGIPYFYPEMVELLGELLKSGYDVWVISASNAWTIRWMVTKVLNEKLRARGLAKGIKPDHVIGITTLLHGPKGKLYKDGFTVLESTGYADLESTELAKYTLTSHIVEPMSSYFGKSATIMQWIGQRPYLVAGDSPNDHGMLPMSQHKLWVARLDNPEIQKLTVELAQKNDPDSWLIQPTLTEQFSGFVSTKIDLQSRFATTSQAVMESLRTLQSGTLLKWF